jgi:hypothetical protein
VVGGWSNRHWTQQNVDDDSTFDQSGTPRPIWRAPPRRRLVCSGCMPWIMRLAGLVLALCLAVSTVLAFPVGPHHGITPIHCTAIDTTVMLIGMFLLYAAVIVVSVEGVLVLLARPTRETLPVARVLR